jgi:hypothetical protein
MNKFVQRMLVVVAVMSCVALVGAQGGGGGQGRGGQGRGGFQRGRGNSELGLAMRADVQKEITVTDDQKKKLEDLQAKSRQNGGGFGGGNGGGQRPTMEEMQKQMAEQRAQQHKDIAAILNEGQMKRLGELLLQREGANALANADTQKALGLTADQVTKIKDLQTKQREAGQALREKMQNNEMTREEMMEATQKNQKTMGEELMKILTADQASKFKAMQGKEFKFEETNRGGGGGGGL